MKPKLYIAAPYAAIAKVRLMAEELSEHNIEVVSTWHHGADRKPGNSTLGRDSEEKIERLLRARQLDCDPVGSALAANLAETDLHEIRKADLFALTGLEYPTHGGCHAEFGYALALAIPIIILGERRNLFHFLPQQPYGLYASSYDEGVENLKNLGAAMRPTSRTQGTWRAQIEQFAAEIFSKKA